MSIRGLVRATHYCATLEAHRDWAWLATWAEAHGHGAEAARLAPAAEAGHRTVDKRIGLLLQKMGHTGPLYKFRERVTSVNGLLSDVPLSSTDKGELSEHA